MNALQVIYDNLQNGKEYGYYYAMRYPVFNTCLWTDNEKKYIYWKYYGRSANENTIESLSWIISTIFDSTPEQFVEKFQIYSEEKFREWEQIADAQNTTEYRRWETD